MTEDNLEYINEDIEDAYDAVQYLNKINDRNRVLVRWTKFGKQVIIKKGR